MGISYSVDNQKKELICNFKEDYIPKIKMCNDGNISLEDIRVFIYIANRIEYFGRFESAFLPGAAAQLGVTMKELIKCIEMFANEDLFTIEYYGNDKTAVTIDFGVKWYC